MSATRRANFVFLLLALWCAGAAPTTAPTVGVEGRIEITLPGSPLQAKPVTEKSKLLLRIASADAAVTGKFYYDLRYIGLVPGQHDLRDYLVRGDGSSLADLPPIPVTIAHLLPNDFDGQLVATSATPWPFFGGYRIAAGAAITLWAVLLLPLILAKRRRAAAAATNTASRPPTLADRLRPLIERAADGSLSMQDKAILERLLLGHWQRRLSLNDRSPNESIAMLRVHPEAGKLLRALEDWLHRPPHAATAQTDIAALLAPYRDVTDPLLDESLHAVQSPPLNLAVAQ